MHTTQIGATEIMSYWFVGHRIINSSTNDGVRTNAWAKAMSGTDLDELALLGGGAGSHDAVAEGEPRRRHLEWALPAALHGLRRGDEEEAGEIRI